jgi:hypothetical protein
MRLKQEHDDACPDFDEDEEDHDEDLKPGKMTRRLEGATHLFRFHETVPLALNDAPHVHDERKAEQKGVFWEREHDEDAQRGAQDDTPENDVGHVFYETIHHRGRSVGTGLQEEITAPGFDK